MNAAATVDALVDAGIVFESMREEWETRLFDIAQAHGSDGAQRAAMQRREIRQRVKVVMMRSLPSRFSPVIGRLREGPGDSALSMGLSSSVDGASGLIERLLAAVQSASDLPPAIRQRLRVVVVDPRPAHPVRSVSTDWRKLRLPKEARERLEGEAELDDLLAKGMS